MAQDGLADAIRRRLGDCSPAERKVGRALLSAYPSAGFETVARLAERAGVSGPTVVRFAHRLGFTGFPDLQQALRDELTAQASTPVSRYADVTTQPLSDAGELLVRAREATLSTARRTFDGTPAHDLLRGVELLSDRLRRICVLGDRRGEPLAGLLSQRLTVLRAGVRQLPVSPVLRAAELLDLRPKDVLVVFDYEPYAPDAELLARFVNQRGAKVVLFTDIKLSPVAATAEVVLPCDTGGPGAHTSMASALAIAETVLSGVLAGLGERAAARLERCERLAADLNRR